MPPVFAGDPAPQQLTAPCRKYSGRLHHPIEQVVYPLFSEEFHGFKIGEVTLRDPSLRDENDPLVTKLVQTSPLLEGSAAQPVRVDACIRR